MKASSFPRFSCNAASFTAAVALTSCLFALPSSAQTQTFKIKWDQPPDPLTPTNIFYGWNDESVTEWVVVADDWACTNADPVTKIRWWGSFIGWKQQTFPLLPVEWKIHIWTDVPAGVDEWFSHPGTNIWEVTRNGTSIIPECVGQDYDPRNPGQPGDPNISNRWETCYLFELPLDPTEYFFQDPLDGTNIYWVSIAARYDTNIAFPDYPFGLKTLPRDTNSLAPDDAVRMFGPTLNNPSLGTAWVVGEGEPIYYPTTNDSWDIAFELCTTNAGDGAAFVKWEQLPDLSTTGIDVKATDDPLATCPPVLLADDFECTQQGPITNIVIWGSWLYDEVPLDDQGIPDPTLVEFTLSIHADIPDPDGTGPEYSQPGQTLWLQTFPAGSFAHSIEVSNILEGFLDPTTCPTNYIFPADTVCHRYEFSIPEPDAFFQDGSAANPVVYWLDVQARLLPITPIQEPRPVFGWKTSLDHWNDDAVWFPGIDDTNGPAPGTWGELVYPPTHPFDSQSIDLAFRITTSAQTNSGQEVLKWSQPPYVADTLTNVYNGWDELSIANSTSMVADDWACTNSDPVSDVHWWGSFFGWCDTNPPAVLPDGFVVTFWTDVPTNIDDPFSHPGDLLWGCTVTNYNMQFVGWDVDPRQQPCFVPESKYKFDVVLDPDCWFNQGDFTEPGTTNIFWISIAAVYSSGLQVDYPFGWETRPHDPTAFPPDDAVVMDTPGGAIPATWMGGFPIEYPTGVSWDMSFQLTSPDIPEQELDWGDAPDSAGGPLYPTLAVNSGANHIIVSNVFLGAGVDADGDGQPNASATGDDINLVYPGIGFPPGDEDGVVITGSLIPGFNKIATVTASVAGHLDAWVDFDASSSWSAAELVYSGPVAAGANAIVFAVPAGATPGTTFSRWRFNTAGAGLPPTGSASDGEVEDHRLFIDQPPSDEIGVDFGDAADLPYPTFLASAGARHTAYTNFVLGKLIDAEPDGQPTPLFDGDDMNIFFAGIPFPPGDEDGVTYTSMPRGGAGVVTVELTSTLGPGRLDAWIDFNNDGVWSAGLPEQIASSTVIFPGFNPIPVAVPTNAVPGNTGARFRLSSTGGLPPTGPSANGEVEDYLIEICQTNLTAFTNLMFTNIVVTNIAGGQVVAMEWNVEPGAVYQVQCASNLCHTPPTVWVDVGPQIASPANVLVLTNTWVTNRYYRICVPSTCP